MTEIELKLALPPKQARRFQALPLLRQATSVTRKHLRNVYYDTPDQRLFNEGTALRIRQQGDLWLQTVKCAGTSSGGLAARPEWETPYGGAFDFSVVDDKAVREHLEHLSRHLTPTFETNFHRTTWKLEPRPGAVLLVMLDRGWIEAQGRRDEICEVEIELAGATSDDLFVLAESLAEQVALTLALRSKAERGYRLHADAKETPAHYTQPQLDEAMAPLDAFRAIALACLEQIIANQAGARRDDDAEYVHQMRVGTRRLRAALQLFRPCLPTDFQVALNSTLADLADCLGQVRDLDVLHSDLLKPALEAQPQDRALAALARQVTAQRKQAAARLGHVLDSIDHGRWLLKVSAELHRLPTPDSSAQNLTAFLEQRLAKLADRVRRQTKLARNGSDEHLHRLRIAAKRLRYAFDASPSNSKPHHVLARAQDVLGQLNDLTRGFVLLASTAANRPTWRAATERLAAFHDKRNQSLKQSAHKLVAELRDLHLPKSAAQLPRPTLDRKTMDIILWRHAEAEDPKPGQNDLDRKLTPKGKKQATRMAAWLAKYLPKDARILVSPAQRTRQTADALGLPYEITDAIAPDATPDQLLKAAKYPKGGNAVLVVGHQPILGQAAGLMISGKVTSWSVKKGGVWWLRKSEDNHEPLQIVAVLSPAHL
ncbi:MAG TPA: CHAD domain-containing protein [Rhodocyclaceae bacterium]|nr:CHAD domain-containing protein [Rhodocyclaceae bacterium]